MNTLNTFFEKYNKETTAAQALKVLQPTSSATPSTLPSTELLNLFSTPVYVSAYKNDFQEEFKYVEHIRFRQKDASSTNNHQSEDSFLFNSPELANIRAFVEKELEHYCANILQVKNRVRITQSWANFNPTGTSHHYHYHPNSILSGVFYMYSGGESPPIQFFRGINSSFKWTPVANSPFTSDLFGVAAQTGDLLIFPSTLPHSVPVNTGAKPRISLSFNTFPIGSMGAVEDLTHVDLTSKEFP